MIRYHYQARDQQNRKISGLVDAIDQNQALKILRSRGLLVVHLEAKKNNWWANFRLMFQRVKKNDILEFTRSLSTMVASGLNLTDALMIITRQVPLAMQKVTNGLREEIEGGSSFYKALGKYPQLFSPLYLALVKSGESAGVLDKVLLRLAETLDKQKEFQSKVKGALIYPVIVVVGMIAVMIIMMIFVLPKLTSMFLDFNLELPLTTRILMFVSNLLAKYWVIALVFLAFAGIFLKKWRETDSGRLNLDEILIRLPIAGKLNTEVTMTEITRTLSLLVAGGVSIIEALNIVSEISGNRVYQLAIKEIASEVEKGASLTASFSSREIFPPIIPQMISVGEETGKLDEVLLKVSKHFEMESEYAIKGLTSAIEPLMIVLLGVGVAFLVIAIIMPIYKLTSSF